MSDPTPEVTPVPAPPTPEAAKPAAPANKPNGPDGFPTETPIADMAPDQALAYWKHKARKHEDAANSNADKAKRYDEFEESQKSETQKAVDRAAAAEAKVAEIEVRAMRSEVAAAKGIPAALLSGTTQEELEASADALLAFRGEKPKPDFGAGDRGDDVTSKGGQITSRDALKSMTPDEIVQAKADGRLDTLLGAKP